MFFFPFSTVNTETSTGRSLNVPTEKTDPPTLLVNAKPRDDPWRFTSIRQLSDG
jgi:hypothetical protein